MDDDDILLKLGLFLDGHSQAFRIGPVEVPDIMCQLRLIDLTRIKEVSSFSCPPRLHQVGEVMDFGGSLNETGDIVIIGRVFEI